MYEMDKSNATRWKTFATRRLRNTDLDHTLQDILLKLPNLLFKGEIFLCKEKKQSTFRPSSDEQFLQAILRYCDKATLQQSNNFFGQKQYFLTKYCYCYCFSKSAEITMN